MKLVSFNLWGGVLYKPLMGYLHELSKTADIFCFQEVFRSSLNETPEDFKGRVNFFNDLSELLPDFKGYFEKTSQNHDTVKKVKYEVDGGQAVFIKKTLEITKKDIFPIYQTGSLDLDPNKDNLPTTLQHFELQIAKTKLQIYNYHGLPYPGNKLDTPKRLEQSLKILEYINKTKGEKILCGDFNLTINTKSVELLEQIGRDLIKDYKIQNTRNEISWKNYNNIQHFADFTFVSSGLKVYSFKVPYNEVSDHLPMILEFDV